MGGGAFYVYQGTFSETPQPLDSANVPPATSFPRSEALDPPVTQAPSTETIDVQAIHEILGLPVGLVVIKDIAGETLARVPAPVVARGWIALPRRVCLGGYDWVLQLGPEKELRIEGGVLSDDDQVGLWRIQKDQRLEGPELYPWRAGKPLVWHSLSSRKPSAGLKLESLRTQGNFIKGMLPERLTEPGILVQDGRMVGWTFGSLLDGGFLWHGDAGENLDVALWVDEFYHMTFADSREEGLTLTMAMGNEYSDVERLAAFANSFRFEPKLSDHDTPAHLRPDLAITRMRALIAQAVRNGSVTEVANTFDALILIQANDIPLLLDVVQATLDADGVEAAIQLTEDVVDRIQPAHDRDLLRVKEFRSYLYKTWITSLIEGGDLQSAWRAFELGSQSLPDDLEIHLLGVQLALTNNDWAEAEDLLFLKDYPLSLQQRVQSLQARVSELKSQAEKIVIRFVPGTERIPVTATLDRAAEQLFVVDTGASMVTIPYSTADRLGLTIDNQNPLHTVYTAGGIRYAPEVVLSSITLKGWEIYNVKALVLDIPNLSHLGLLGLNYLSRFRMDLNPENGILSLQPR